MCFRGISWFLLALPLFCFSQQQEPSKKGEFEVGNSLVPVNEIMFGGPEKDGIPALMSPEFIAADKAWFLKPQDRVLAIQHNGLAKAYPINILNWHEVVNDQISDLPIVVSYCPLCGSGMIFKRPQMVTSFGVSGLLYNSDVLLYDRDSHSLWSQIMMKAVSGPLQGQSLELLSATHTSWQSWRERFPATLVLSNSTGYVRDYSRDPYQGYRNTQQLFFPVSDLNNQLHPKAWVLGVQIKQSFKAYPFDELDKVDEVIIKKKCLFAGIKKTGWLVFLMRKAMNCQQQ
jgi:hypothetical protein